MEETLEVEIFAIPGLLLLKPPLHRDVRGELVEVYQESKHRQRGVTDRFVQDNLSTSQQGVLRGLHFQLPPAAQAKLIRVLHGEIFDVVLDLRQDSASYLSWHTVALLPDSGTLYIPPGCAHGLCVLSTTATVLYKLSAEYSPELERGINALDPALGIDWPVAEPVRSPRDAALPSLEEVLRRLAQDMPAC